tara:strand:- start:10086 stop:10391 length:306 start_codon:yes stop_codon:yes gene_type:complete
MKLNLDEFLTVDLELIGDALGGDITELHGEYIGKYGARIVAKTRAGQHHAFALSCGRLGAFDREVGNDFEADYSQFDMNWNHMIDAALEQPFKWRNWNFGS